MEGVEPEFFDNKSVAEVGTPGQVDNEVNNLDPLDVAPLLGSIIVVAAASLSLGRFVNRRVNRDRR